MGGEGVTLSHSSIALLIGIFFSWIPSYLSWLRQYQTWLFISLWWEHWHFSLAQLAPLVLRILVPLKGIVKILFKVNVYSSLKRFRMNSNADKARIKVRMRGKNPFRTLKCSFTIFSLWNSRCQYRKFVLQTIWTDFFFINNYTFTTRLQPT